MSANPASAIKPGEMVMPFGSPGSEVLGQAMVQVFLNQAVFGMDPQSACEAPRFASNGGRSGSISRARCARSSRICGVG
jgi:gamma-glutamyltranspeptidase/glutathione hydrolase